MVNISHENKLLTNSRKFKSDQQTQTAKVNRKISTTNRFVIGLFTSMLYTHKCQMRNSERKKNAETENGKNEKEKNSPNYVKSKWSWTRFFCVCHCAFRNNKYVWVFLQRMTSTCSFPVLLCSLLFCGRQVHVNATLTSLAYMHTLENQRFDNDDMHSTACEHVFFSLGWAELYSFPNVREIRLPTDLLTVIWNPCRESSNERNYLFANG